VETANTLKAVTYSGRFSRQLCWIGDVLPTAATAALFEVRAARRHAIRRGTLNCDEIRLHVATMNLAHPRAHDFARSRAGHEDCQAVGAADSFSAVGQTVDGYNQFIARPWAWTLG
jgi:hypothetical protein